jgi:hypothetical protein
MSKYREITWTQLHLSTPTLSIVRIMLLSLVSSIALAGLVTVGGVPYVTHKRKEAITCVPVSGATGTLVIISLAEAPITLPAGGLPLTTDGGILAPDGQNLHEEFVFESCTSNYMGLFTTFQGSFAFYYG